jgi:hypothetical protein
MSARRLKYPDNRTSSVSLEMSQLGQFETCAPQQQLLLDHLVGDGEQSRRDGEAEAFSGLHIDCKLHFPDLFHRQLGWLIAFKDAAGVNADLTENFCDRRGP